MASVGGAGPSLLSGGRATALALATVTLYAAYGSNLDPDQMQQRCPHSPASGTGWVPGWRLTFGGEDYGWEGALATLVPDEKASSVFVGLYDLSADDADLLDAWEGADHGLYRKVKVRVATLAGSEKAWCYVLDAFEGGLPSARYLGQLADAAALAGAPDDYVRDLRLRPCRSND